MSIELIFASRANYNSIIGLPTIKLVSIIKQSRQILGLVCKGTTGDGKSSLDSHDLATIRGNGTRTHIACPDHDGDSAKGLILGKSITCTKTFDIKTFDIYV